MSNTGAVPDDTYFVYYYFSDDAAFDADEFPFQADGTLTIGTDDAGNYTGNIGFEILPNTPVVNKGDVLDFTVYANDGGSTAEIISFGITFDNTKFSASDMIAVDDGADNDNDRLVDEDGSEDSGTQPFQSHAAASQGWTFSGVPADGSKITLISEGVTKVYEHDQDANGVAVGSVEIADAIGTAALFADALKAIIDGATGHNAGTVDSKLKVRVETATITITQALSGQVGNTTITLAGAMAAAITDPL